MDHGYLMDVISLLICVAIAICTPPIALCVCGVRLLREVPNSHNKNIGLSTSKSTSLRDVKSDKPKRSWSFLRRRQSKQPPSHRKSVSRTESIKTAAEEDGFHADGDEEFPARSPDSKQVLPKSQVLKTESKTVHIPLQVLETIKGGRRLTSSRRSIDFGIPRTVSDLEFVEDQKKAMRKLRKSLTLEPTQPTGIGEQHGRHEDDDEARVDLYSQPKTAAMPAVTQTTQKDSAVSNVAQRTPTRDDTGKQQAMGSGHHHAIPSLSRTERAPRSSRSRKSSSSSRRRRRGRARSSGFAGAIQSGTRSRKSRRRSEGRGTSNQARRHKSAGEAIVTSDRALLDDRRKTRSADQGDKVEKRGKGSSEEVVRSRRTASVQTISEKSSQRRKRRSLGTIGLRKSGSTGSRIRRGSSSSSRSTATSESTSQRSYQSRSPRLVSGNRLRERRASSGDHLNWPEPGLKRLNWFAQSIIK